MFFEDENKDYKMVAPDIDELIAYFDHIYVANKVYDDLVSCFRTHI